MVVGCGNGNGVGSCHGSGSCLIVAMSLEENKTQLACDHAIRSKAVKALIVVLPQALPCALPHALP